MISRLGVSSRRKIHSANSKKSTALEKSCCISILASSEIRRARLYHSFLMWVISWLSNSCFVVWDFQYIYSSSLSSLNITLIHFTENVINAIGPKATPRTREVMSALIRHVHDFAREVELSVDEWMMGVHFVNSIGQISTKVRNEGQRISDVLGLESYVPLRFSKLH